MTAPDPGRGVCWRCGTVLERLTRITDGADLHEPGSVVLDVDGCGAVNIMTGNELELRAATDAEIAELMTDPEFMAIAAKAEIERDRRGRRRRRNARLN